MTRAASWTNSDGLVVGFGANIPERQAGGVVDMDGYDRVATLAVTYASTFGASGAKITIPANSIVRNVYMKVGTAWVGGTSLAFGDAGGTGSWITATQGAQASLTAGVAIQALGGYAWVTGESQQTPKVYAAATDLYFTVVGTFTAGSATVVVEYV